MKNDKTYEYLTKIKEIYGDNLFLNSDIVKNLNVINNRTSVTDNLYKIKNDVSNCLKCQLGKVRKNIVFGVGAPNADLMLIGEAPGEKEDEIGEPFVGRAGVLLDRILHSIKLK